MEHIAAAIPPELLAHLKNAGTSKALTSETDPLARERRRVEAANRVPGQLEGFDCPDCLNRGFIHALDKTGHFVTRPCKCAVRRNNERRIRLSGLSELVGRYTFQNWKTPSIWQEKAKHLAENYARNPAGWFVATGSVGTGKSHLCTAICVHLMECGQDVRYMLWRDVSVQAKAVVNDDEEYSRIVEPLKRTPVLYVDDLFKTGKGQEPTVGDVNLAFEILNARYNDSKKLTIISTERSVEELLNIDEAVGSRIYERSKGNYLDFRGRENWRLK